MVDKRVLLYGAGCLGLLLVAGGLFIAFIGLLFGASENPSDRELVGPIVAVGLAAAGGGAVIAVRSLRK